MQGTWLPLRGRLLGALGVRGLGELGHRLLGADMEFSGRFWGAAALTPQPVVMEGDPSSLGHFGLRCRSAQGQILSLSLCGSAVWVRSSIAGLWKAGESLPPSPLLPRAKGAMHKVQVLPCSLPGFRLLACSGLRTERRREKMGNPDAGSTRRDGPQRLGAGTGAEQGKGWRKAAIRATRT